MKVHERDIIRLRNGGASIQSPVATGISIRETSFHRSNRGGQKRYPFDRLFMFFFFLFVVFFFFFAYFSAFSSRTSTPFSGSGSRCSPVDIDDKTDQNNKKIAENFPKKNESKMG